MNGFENTHAFSKSNRPNEPNAFTQMLLVKAIDQTSQMQICNANFQI